jgi:hypothetical protein
VTGHVSEKCDGITGCLFCSSDKPSPFRWKLGTVFTFPSGFLRNSRDFVFLGGSRKKCVSVKFFRPNLDFTRAHVSQAEIDPNWRPPQPDIPPGAQRNPKSTPKFPICSTGGRRLLEARASRLNADDHSGRKPSRLQPPAGLHHSLLLPFHLVAGR